MSSTPGQSSSVRVGDAERQSAIAQLRSQWQAGRLDPTEHEARTTKAYAAVTRGDLDALFVDLPALTVGNTSHNASPFATGTPGHPVSPGAPGTPMPSTVPGIPVPTAGAATPGRGGLLPQGSWIHRKRNAIMPLMPFVALGLFFLTEQWYFFLLIPVAAIVLYAGEDGSGYGDKARRRQERDEQRSRRRQDRDERRR